RPRPSGCTTGPSPSPCLCPVCPTGGLLSAWARWIKKRRSLDEASLKIGGVPLAHGGGRCRCGQVDEEPGAGAYTGTVGGDRPIVGVYERTSDAQPDT